MAMNRRTFLANTAAITAASLAPRQAKAADSQIEIMLDEPIGTIAPELHGHFTEHIGGVVYDGIWVGQGSSIPNIGGIRKALVESMRKLNVPVVRWPGGCFADGYNWRDGIGPAAKRPCRPNYWVTDPDSTEFMRRAPDGPQKYDPNAFGTNEFISFCHLIGAQPYLAANVRSLSPLDFDQWVEYCNAPPSSTTLADARSSNGSREPFRVRYWGVGNESWGCGGNFLPQEYASEFRKFTTWVPDFGVNLRFIGSGPNEDDFAWTRGFFEALVAKGKEQLDNVWGWALHYYCGTSGKGQAVDFTTEDWYDLLGKADKMGSLIERHWSAMGEADPTHKVKLVVDEWGAWHKPGSEVNSAFLFGQMPTMRDALISALTLDTFHRHADKLGMANVAQLINNLHTLFLAHEDRFALTPNYHVFDMYQAHQGGQSVRMLVAAPPVPYRREADGAPATLWGLAGSASVKGEQLAVTMVNPHASDARSAEVTVQGGSIRTCKVRTLSAPDIHAHNTFDQPHAVEPLEETASVRAGMVVWNFKPASVTRLDIEVG
jgi:alpha-N-arabinofuranosidase